MPASGLQPLIRASSTNLSSFRWSVVRSSSTLLGRTPTIKGSRRRGLSWPYVQSASPSQSLTAPGRRYMMMSPPFPLPWDSRTKAREEAELELYRRFSSLCSFLDTDVHLPDDSPFRKWLVEKSSQIRSGSQVDAKKEVEALAQMLKEAQAMLVELEKAKISAFKREWWRPESVDYQDARLALHYSGLRHLVTLLLAEPIIPNSTTRPAGGQDGTASATPTPVSHLILDVMESWVDGGQDERLKAYWPLCDSDRDGYLSQAEMDKAVYGNIKPLEQALRECFLTLPSLTKKQKKKFEKYMKFYTRDQEDYPNKLRCIFAWAKKSRDAPRDEDKRITYDEYLVTQKEYFASLGKTSQECITLFAKTRVYDHEVSADNRETIRYGLIYFFLLAAGDIWVSTV